MNKRRSKSMMKLKKRICRITVISVVVGTISLIYYQNFMMDMVDQYIDQKYDLIASKKNLTAGNTTHTVEKMPKGMHNMTMGTSKKTVEFEPKSPAAPFGYKDQEQDWDTEGEQWNAIGFMVSANYSELHRGHHGHHGEFQHHHPMHHEGNFSHHKEDHDMKHREEQKEGNWKKKRDPYKEWLDKLPCMDKEVARSQANAFWKCVIGGIAIWTTIIYAIQQGFQ